MEDKQKIIEQKNAEIKKIKEEVKRLQAEIKAMSPPASLKSFVTERPYRWESTRRADGTYVYDHYTNKDKKGKNGATFLHGWEPYRMICHDFFGDKRINQLNVDEMKYAAKMIDEMIQIYNARFLMYHGYENEHQMERSR